MPAKKPTIAPEEQVDNLQFEIRALRDGHRRAGRAWSTSPAMVPASELTQAQIEALEADPVIRIIAVTDSGPQGDK